MDDSEDVVEALQRLDAEGNKAFLVAWRPKSNGSEEESLDYFFEGSTSEEDVRGAVLKGAMRFQPHLKELIRRFVDENE